jgi:hypothetical protein
MQVLNKSFSANSKSASTTIKLELNCIDHLFYISTTKGRTSVSKLDNFKIEGGMVIHDFGDIMANMNAIRPIPNAITRATEKALWTEHDKQLDGIRIALIQKYEA